MPGQWVGSTRRAQLPVDWDSTRRPRILRRDGHQCTWMTDGQRCDQPATDVDHIRRGNDHNDNNLRSLCAWHHKRKTSIEGNTSRRRHTTKRTPEQHPGLT